MAKPGAEAYGAAVQRECKGEHGSLLWGEGLGVVSVRTLRIGVEIQHEAEIAEGKLDIAADGAVLFDNRFGNAVQKLCST